MSLKELMRDEKYHYIMQIRMKNSTAMEKIADEHGATLKFSSPYLIDDDAYCGVFCESEAQGNAVDDHRSLRI